MNRKKHPELPIKEEVKLDLGGKLAKLAELVVDGALSEDVSLESRLDALKTAGSYHLAAVKAGEKKKDESNNSNFGKYAERIRNAEKESENGDDE